MRPDRLAEGAATGLPNAAMMSRATGWTGARSATVWRPARARALTLQCAEADTTSVNGPAANIYGAEFAVQHLLGDSGFGFQANATLVGTDTPYNPHNLAVSGFAVTGLADSANIVAFYDKDGFQARVAANWRDGYLDHLGKQKNK